MNINWLGCDGILTRIGSLFVNTNALKAFHVQFLDSYILLQLNFDCCFLGFNACVWFLTQLWFGSMYHVISGGFYQKKKTFLHSLIFQDFKLKQKHSSALLKDFVELGETISWKDKKAEVLVSFCQVEFLNFIKVCY